MNIVLSIDLVHTTIRKIGVCLLEESRGRIGSTTFVEPAQLGLVDPLHSGSFAASIYKFCLDEHIHLLLLDGPQGWKDPANGLAHSACAREF